MKPYTLKVIMTKKIKKRIGYKKEFSKKFYDYCCMGYSLARIAHLLGCTRDQFFTWSKDPRYSDFSAAWKKGKEACQAFHEARLDDMITGKVSASAAAISAQQNLLRVQFKEDWSEKQESKVTVENTGPQFTDEQLVSQILSKLRKKEIFTELEGHLKEQLEQELDKDNKTIN